MTSVTRVEINGEPASVEAVHRAATWNYGHYTSMQVRRHRVAGLGLHLRRLREASAVLFPDRPAPEDHRITELISHALHGAPDASVRVTVLPAGSKAGGTEVMVSVSDAVPDAARPPLQVRTVTHERELPGLKHLATMSLSYHRLEAVRAGFDDVLLAGRDGSLLEGSAWNVAFWDGDRVVWPRGPMLAGITMRLLRPGLAALGIPDEDREVTTSSLAGMTGAAAINSQCPAQPIAAIDGSLLPGHAALTGLLRQAWRHVAWETVGQPLRACVATPSTK